MRHVAEVHVEQEECDALSRTRPCRDPGGAVILKIREEGADEDLRRTRAGHRLACSGEDHMSETGMRQLAVGLTYSRSVKVTDDMTPAHLRSEPIRVLSTPDMIRLIEQTAIEAVAPCLAPGQATVGTRVDVAHLAATPVGMTVTITVELVEIDRRRLGFRVAVRDERDEAGKGETERVTGAAAGRMPRLQDKLSRWKAVGGGASERRRGRAARPAR